MAGGDSPYSEDWFRVAEEDLQRVGRRLAEEDVADAAFRLQQAIEKCLKGFLLSRGWRLQRIHDLEVLLDEALPYAPKLRRYRLLCQEVAAYYIVERYPTLEEHPSLVEVRAAYGQVRKLFADIRGGMRGRG